MADELTLELLQKLNEHLTRIETSMRDCISLFRQEAILRQTPMFGIMMDSHLVEVIKNVDLTHKMTEVEIKHFAETSGMTPVQRGEFYGKLAEEESEDS